MQYQVLSWDTDFFCHKVARIDKSDLNKDELTDIILKLKVDGVSLVYFPSSKKFEEQFIKNLGGILADIKTTFAMDFGTVTLEEYVPNDIVESYMSFMSIKDIEDLAIQSGKYSRYAVDPNIPMEKFEALYKIWVNRSLKKEIAKEVLVIREDDRVAGMITLGEQNGRGDIGLIAVDANYRGKNYGEKLVCAAQRWFVMNGYNFGQVVTQGMNLPACNLYTKRGYSVEKVEYFYHFWLKNIV